MSNNALYERFLLLAEDFNRQSDIVPLLYGSLGLEVLTGADTYPEDIDVLVPLAFLQDRWDELRQLIESRGYALVDLREREFDNGQHKIAFADIEDLEAFAGIRPEEIEEREDGAAKYKLLNLRQYYAVYNRSVLDGYRIGTRNKKDNEKIELIENLLGQ